MVKHGLVAVYSIKAVAHLSKCND